MDFLQWSPSHTVLVLFIILGFIGQVAILFYRTSRLEKHQDKTDERIDKQGGDINLALKEQGETFFHALERLEDRMDKRFVEVIDTMNQRLDETNKRIDDTNQRLSDMQAETNQRLSDMQAETNQRLSDMQGEIRDVRLEMSKLNQNHIDHLSHHEEKAR